MRWICRMPGGARVLRRVSAAACAVAAVGAGAAHAAAAPVSFAPVSYYSAGTAPAADAIGDYNGDGHPDIAVANSAMFGPSTGGASVSILLNRGDGTYAKHGADIATGGAQAIVTGDFNSDGNADLAVADQNDNDVAILLGRGDGSFAAPTTVPVGNGPARLAVADFNADGKLDLAVADAYDGKLTILEGSGNGTFGPAGTAMLSVGASALVVGDFDGRDGPDLAAGTPDGNVEILLNDGTGGFGTPTTVLAGTQVFDLAVGDFDGRDGPDLAAADIGQPGGGAPGGVAVLLNDGTGGFTKTAELPVDGSATTVAVGDFDRDGRRDLASSSAVVGGATTFGASKLSVRLGNGDGTFGDATDVDIGANLAFGARAADLDGDGIDDVAFAAPFTGNVGVLLVRNPGPASLSPASRDYGETASGSNGATQTFMLTAAAGHSPVTVGKVAIAGDNGDDFVIVGDECSRATLAAGQSCAVRVRFTPTATGARSATLTFSDDASNGPQTATLRGTGTAPATGGGGGTPPTGGGTSSGGAGGSTTTTVVVPGPPAPPAPVKLVTLTTYKLTLRSTRTMGVRVACPGTRGAGVYTGQIKLSTLGAGASSLVAQPFDCPSGTQRTLTLRLGPIGTRRLARGSHRRSGQVTILARDSDGRLGVTSSRVTLNVSTAVAHALLRHHR